MTRLERKIVAGLSVIAVVFLVVMILISCAAQNKVSCPAEDSMIFVGPGIPVIIPKGFFDDRENYLTKDQLEKKSEEEKDPKNAI